MEKISVLPKTDWNKIRYIFKKMQEDTPEGRQLKQMVESWKELDKERQRYIWAHQRINELMDHLGIGVDEA